MNEVGTYATKSAFERSLTYMHTYIHMSVNIRMQVKLNLYVKNMSDVTIGS